MRRISIAPADRLRRLVVVPDVPTDLPREIVDRGEDATGEQIPFDLGEPEFDLIQPRGIRRREVQAHVGVRDQDGPHRLRLVGREIVENHVNLAPRRLTGDDVAEELDKGRAGVSRHGLREQRAGPRVERGKERQRAVPVVLEAMAFGAARRER